MSSKNQNNGQIDSNKNSNKMKSEHQFTQALKETPTFKGFEKFNQGITLKRSNIINLYDKYQQAHRYGVDYLKQNQNILANDVKMIGEVLEN